MKTSTLKSPSINVKRITKLFIFLFLLSISKSYSQTLYVDAVKGKTGAAGSIKSPLSSLEEAVQLTHTFKGDQPVTINIGPGLYILKDQLLLKTAVNSANNTAYTIQALTMPDNKRWDPKKMPVIQSISGVNDTTGFAHCIGLSVLKNKVTIRGIKFLGNPNTQVQTYYPIRRADKSLDGLQVSQCAFVGQRKSAPIQSAFWISGSGIHIDHCTFNSCKIAMVLGSRLDNFSFSYSIIDGAYNTAIWYGFAGTVKSFVLKNNVITNSNYVMVYPVEDGQPGYTITDSFLSNNAHYLGNYPKDQESFVSEKISRMKEINVIKLNDASQSRHTGAGIFKIPSAKKAVRRPETNTAS